ncbi:MAG TPA: IclR family transcriptional regulator [Gaiellaceae bacterium]|nr:IclR family transcriptional regulator [Gaiellaceae bacterium]
MASDAASGSQTLDRALAALVHIGECGARGLTLAECSASLGYSKPTAHRILRTLAARGFLRVDRERGLYSLGPANLRLGMAFLDQLDLRSEALPILRQLREQTGETVHLGVLDRHDVVYIEKVESEHAVRMFSRIGSTMPAYSTGVGKAILASLPPDELEQALPERLEARTPRTIVDRAKLRRHLAEVRRRGYSTDDIENEDGIRCVGAPVFDHSGHVCAGISVAGPATRVTPERFAELGLLVQEAAATISWRLGYGGAADRAGAAGAR